IALKAATAEAERASAAKSEFLSRMSHELRTPLNAILGFAQLLEMDELEADQRSGVKQILKSGRHLLELVNEVLDIASIDAGRLSLSCEPVQLSDLAEETIAMLRPLAEARSIRFENNIEIGHVFADQQRLKQVLLNLMSNAIKYNRVGGKVRLSSALVETERVRFEVADTGPGIPLDGQQKMFSPFERLDAGQKGIEGTGIGLTISQRLVHLMGGEIGLYSVENEGTTFWVELPGAEDPAHLEESQQAKPTGKGGATTSTTNHNFDRTVLYIEDNLSNLSLIENLFARRANIRLLTAMQGRRGLELACEHRPDLILLDVHLPDMPGDEVLYHLRAEAATQGIPVVMLSADATPRQAERLLAAGATDYLTKPLDVKRFLHLIDTTL
ncbi:MAG TPA: ATP-binding protein, partial [Abditibacteriaceae bacterium]